VIGLYSAAYCHGDAVAAKTASRLGYRLITDGIYDLASSEFGVSSEKLEKVARSQPPFWNKLTHHHERYLAYLGLALAQLMKSPDVLVHGRLMHLIPRSVSHILRVCLVADLEYRVEVARQVNDCSDNDIEYSILLEDGEMASWARSYLGYDPCASKVYDLVIPMHFTSVDEAVSTICEHAQLLDAHGDDEYRDQLGDFLLAATVRVLLAEKGHYVRVSASGGEISITLDEYVTRLQHYKEKLERLAKNVPGVEKVTVTPGTGFLPPSLTRTVEIDVPPAHPRVLLVDDERDFVHSLSERLEARDIPSTVVYDGTEALSFLEREEPEVIVLDLRMPGVDGIEVLRRVKLDHPDIEVIILTGHGSDREERLARQLGAFEYLKKPLDIDELTKVMKKAYAEVAKRKLGEVEEVD
jgi:CheY-like chemotaxis protein